MYIYIYIYTHTHMCSLTRVQAHGQAAQEQGPAIDNNTI